MAEYEALIQNLRSIDEYDTGYAKLIYDAADAIEELSRRCEQFMYMPPPAWIPVTERLPEDMVDVLCYYEYFRYGNYNCMFRTIDRGHVFKGRWFGEAGEGHKNKVFAWMPLPEPYKDGEQDG